MLISNILSTYQSCEETRQIRAASKARSKKIELKQRAIDMIKKGIPNWSIVKQTGLSRTTISVYKAKLEGCTV